MEQAEGISRVLNFRWNTHAMIEVEQGTYQFPKLFFIGTGVIESEGGTDITRWARNLFCHRQSQTARWKCHKCNVEGSESGRTQIGRPCMNPRVPCDGPRSLTGYLRPWIHIPGPSAWSEVFHPL